MPVLLQETYPVSVRKEVTVSSRGTVTIPAEVRRAMGLKGNDRLVVETTDRGLLLCPAALVLTELYSDQRIDEFESDNEAIAQAVTDLEAR